MIRLSRTAAITRAVDAVEARSVATSAVTRDGLVEQADIEHVGRVTVAFHPDRRDRRGLTTAEGLVTDGGFLPQWVTGASSGSRSARAGGLRAEWERKQFAVDDDVEPRHRPVYGAWDLLHHRHGGSPEFGSCYLVLDDAVRARCTLSIGDSHLAPDRVGTFRRPAAVLGGLADQAAEGRLLGQNLGTADLRAVLAGDRRHAPRRTTRKYVEVQVHGGVDLQDITGVLADPCFADSDVEDHLREAAAAAAARFSWHPGTVVAPRDLATHPTAIDLVDDDAYLKRLTTELEHLAASSPVATAATIGRLVADSRPGPPSLTGDPERSSLQRVKHLWRLTYRLGRDATSHRRDADDNE